MPAAPATQDPALAPLRSPLFEPDTTFEFLNSEPKCTGTTCTHEMTLSVRNRARP